MFKDYYKNILETYPKKRNNYIGISKKEFPKWEGWEIIESYKHLNKHIQDIDDVYLNVLVENFYRIKYIQEKF